MQKSLNNHDNWPVKSATKTKNKPFPGAIGTTSIPAREVTLFKNLFDITHPEYMMLTDVVSRIRDGNSKELVTRIRQGEIHLKNALPCICFSGIFDRRDNSSLVKPSGLAVLDYGNLENVNSFKDHVCKNPFTHVAFISPSGKGLKVIVKIHGDHVESYRKLSQYYPPEGLEMAEKIKKFNLAVNISRVTFESWDQDIYFNLSSKVFQ